MLATRGSLYLPACPPLLALLCLGCAPQVPELQVEPPRAPALPPGFEAPDPARGLPPAAEPQDLPDDPIQGVSNGEAFVAAFVAFQRRGESWYLVVCQEPPASEAEPTRGVPHLALDLPHPPQAGAVFRHEQAEGGGYWRLRDHAADGQLVEFRAASTWTLVVDDWHLSADQADPGQPLGHASGRVEVHFSGSRAAGIEPSHAAGRFEDVPILAGP